MTFDVIITTYNRPERVERFVKQLLNCSPTPQKIIVVDSSDLHHPSLHKMIGIKYIRSSHKNQPYQRYLGAAASNADIVCFFDDDLEVTNSQIFELILLPYKDKFVVGSSIGIDYHNSINNHTTSSLIEPSTKLAKILLNLSGVKLPPRGKISYAGMTGHKPTTTQEVDFFYGPCMSFRKDVFNLSLNKELLNIFELKMGMGEDKVISMTISQYGKLIYNPTVCLFHPAIESSYFHNLTEFTAKTLYSRKLLNEVYTRSMHKNIPLAKLQLIWYTIGRLTISLFMYLLKRDLRQKQKLKGNIKGIKLLLNTPQIATYDWTQNIVNDLKPQIEKNKFI